MSRTHNTRPWRARPESYEPYHDHRNGECDLMPLDEYLKLPRRQRWFGKYRCTWTIKFVVKDTRCSCDGCRNRPERRRETKKQRRDRSYLNEF